jgi:hypothetical protein
VLESILTESARFRTDARKLLEETGILRLLAKHGRVELTGSYVLDLMMSPDIDVKVVRRSMTKGKALSLFNAIAKQGRFQSCVFNDNVKHRDPRFPPGYYIWLKRPHADDRWKIDIWCLKEGGRDERVMKSILGALSRRNKLAILRLKKWARGHRPGLSSMEIYEAVLRRHTISVRDFKRFLGTTED